MPVKTEGKSSEHNYPINLYWLEDLLRTMNERKEVVCVDDVFWVFGHITNPDDEYKDFFNELVADRNKKIKFPDFPEAS